MFAFSIAFQKQVTNSKKIKYKIKSYFIEVLRMCVKQNKGRWEHRHNQQHRHLRCNISFCCYLWSISFQQEHYFLLINDIVILTLDILVHSVEYFSDILKDILALLIPYSEELKAKFYTLVDEFYNTVS